MISSRFLADSSTVAPSGAMSLHTYSTKMTSVKVVITAPMDEGREAMHGPLYDGNAHVSRIEMIF